MVHRQYKCFHSFFFFFFFYIPPTWEAKQLQVHFSVVFKKTKKKKQVVHLKNNEALIPSAGLYSMKSNRNSVADKQRFPISLSAAQWLCAL